jgi:hypothetical protein
MKRFVVFLVAVTFAAAMLGAFPAIARADGDVPFIGFAAVQLATDGSLAGSGEGTVLGPFTESSDPVMIYMEGDENKFSAMVTLTATANGDQVFKMANGTVTSDGTTTIFSGTFTVNGGTGQFVQATGSGEVVMVLFPDGTFSQAYIGTIKL